MINWRRNAVLATLPSVRENRVRTPWREFWRRFRRQHVAMISAVFVLVPFLGGRFFPLIGPFDAGKHYEYFK